MVIMQPINGIKLFEETNRCKHSIPQIGQFISVNLWTHISNLVYVPVKWWNFDLNCISNTILGLKSTQTNAGTEKGALILSEMTTVKVHSDS